nr:glycosyltransferase [Curtobacterium sp. MCBA15_001]
MAKTRARSVAIIGTRGYPSYYGGFETAVRHVAPRLADDGWDVTVYGRPGTTVTTDTDPRVRRVTTFGWDRKSASTLTYGLTAVLHAVWKKPDVALVMNVANGPWLPLLKLRGIRVIVNVDGIEWERAKWGALAKAVFRAGAWMTGKFADRLVVDARALGDHWKRRYRRASVFIPYGGDFTPAPASSIPFERRRYVLVVARLVPENTIEEFLEAAPELAEHHDVVIVGSSGYGGPIDEAAKRLSATHPRVHWLGHVRDDAYLHRLWEDAGAYFHGHSVGGTNPALVQAMASGAPTVARDTVYTREVLGDTGVFVQPDARSIVAAISAVLASADQQEALSAAARARARTEYTWERVGAAYSNALEELRRGPTG